MRPIFACGLVVVVACASRTYRFEFPERSAKLKNGIQVVLLPDPSSEVVEVDVRYDVGSRDDPPGKAGLAHLVEHLMFQQRQAGPDAPTIGAAFRRSAVWVNAFTDWDSTHYMALADAASVDTLVGLEAARLQTGCNTIDAAALDREREVVRNELRSVMPTPGAQVSYQVLQALYPEGHPYQRIAAGTDAEISSITLEDVCRFMVQFYTPERATFLIGGKIDQPTAEGLVGKYLAGLPPRQGAPHGTVPPVPDKPPVPVIELEADVEETTVIGAWPLPPRHSDDFLATVVLFGGVAGLVEQHSYLAEITELSYDIVGGAHAPYFVVLVSFSDPSGVGTVRSAIDRAVDTIQFWFRADAVRWDKMRSLVIGGMVAGIEPLPRRTLLFGDLSQFRGDAATFSGEMARIGRLDADSVQRVATRVFSPERTRLIVVRPKRGAKAPHPRASLQYAAPRAEVRREEFPVERGEAAGPLGVPERALGLRGARALTLDNGLQVFLLPRAGGLPVVTAQIVFGAGTAHDPPERDGVAALSAQLLFSEGAGRFAQVGGRLTATVARDTTTFSMQGLEVYLDILLQGLKDHVYRDGLYDSVAIDRKATALERVEKRRSYREGIAFLSAFYRSLYGAGHPYGKPMEPSAAQARLIRKHYLEDFNHENYDARNATLVVAGRFDAQKAEELVRRHFGSLDEGRPNPPIAPPAAPNGQVVLGVAGQRAEIVPLAIGYRTPTGVGEDYAARLVLAEILDRRAATVRERLGAAYSVGARAVENAGAGALVVACDVDRERAGEALRSLREAIATVREGSGFVEDFVRARRTVLERRLAQSTDSSALAERLAWIARNHLSIDFEDKLIGRIAALTPRDVMGLAGTLLAPEGEVVVLLGERSVLERAFTEAEVRGRIVGP